MKLYEIANQFKDALEALNNAETEAEYYEAEVRLSALDADKDAKLEACCAHLKNLRAEEEMIDNEIHKLKDKLDSAQAKANKFEAYLAACLVAGEPWTKGIHLIRWRPSKRVIITSEEEIPSAYKVEHLSYTPDKALLKKDLECGATIPGVCLKEYQNIQIR